jgi:hypothetical protein
MRHVSVPINRLSQNDANKRGRCFTMISMNKIFLRILAPNRLSSVAYFQISRRETLLKSHLCTNERFCIFSLRQAYRGQQWLAGLALCGIGCSISWPICWELFEGKRGPQKKVATLFVNYLNTKNGATN